VGVVNWNELEQDSVVTHKMEHLKQFYAVSSLRYMLLAWASLKIKL
jgi:hypothetical protein